MLTCNGFILLLLRELINTYFNVLSNIVNINGYSSHKQSFFEALNNF